MDDDLLNLKKYPSVMYMNIYGDGYQTWDRLPNDVIGKTEQIFETVFSAKYIRADLVQDQIERVHERHQKTIVDMDTNGTDYLVVRSKVAELSGESMMSLTFDGHIEVIRKKLQETTSKDEV